MLSIAFVPSAALVLVALFIGGFLVQQAIQDRDDAESGAIILAEASRGIASLQRERAVALRAPGSRSATYTAYADRIDTSLSSLREVARAAPDAEVGYQQTIAVELLAAVEGMDRSDSLAVAGIDDEGRRDYAAAVGAYRSRLDAVAGKLTESSRRTYRDLVESVDWSRFGAVETALSAATPPPVGQDAWRVAAGVVGRTLGDLAARQIEHSAQLAIDGGRRVLSGALAAAAAISLLAVVVMAIVMQLARRLPIPIIRCPSRLDAVPLTWSHLVSDYAEKSTLLAHTSRRGGRADLSG
ncbi:nitrate- and nitrite sensing domain-containing protein [Amycolatopsis sp. EV170708-02-1]|uniref:nitrate- and nitrite sensing domain-containing protein n=1 Tax=Amycolatopsis sp. EV170708-02-1 TaxID=2919322 RepID=UPI001F0C6B3E|nr:nitrate- and nitrite sensing domain-containing protein [Amycolatopsis sp. EV170708-02-1]UMP02653.1 nitrate- and nitrite sensing domain-containing protein [Amycolatopsis sp. EV170708-02-1]